MRRRDLLLGLAALAAVGGVNGVVQSQELGTVVYAQADGLWVRTLPHGVPQQLASGSAIHNPRFSPSGTWISYEALNATNVVRRDGSGKMELPRGGYEWVQGRADVLALANHNGLQLLDGAKNWAGSLVAPTIHRTPVFSRDGSQFVYSYEIKEGQTPVGNSVVKEVLSRYVVGGSRDAQILVSGKMVRFVPFGWTQDGKSILYWRDPDGSASVAADGLELYRIGVNGGVPQPLKVVTLGYKDMLALSPVGAKFVLAAGWGRATWNGKRIAILSLSSGRLRYLTATDVSAVTPSWSPDGRKVAFAAAPAAPSEVEGGPEAKLYLDQRRIWTADTVGAGSPTQITRDNRYRDEEPMWSADGRKILFCRMDRGNASTLWLTGSDGSSPEQVSGPLSLEGWKAPIYRTSWFGDYGHVGWRAAFDWFRPIRRTM